MSLQPPKGTRDFYPEDMAVQNHIFSAWRETARLFGFEEYEGPVFEHLELFTKKSGPEIVKQLYNFKDKSDRELALRPEITPTLARLVVQKGSSLKKPLKWFSIPRLFRYERMQKGRSREFFQLNLDILGEPSVSADAELMAAAVHMLKSLGLTKNDFSIRVNSRKLVSEILMSYNLQPEFMAAAYGLMDKHGKPDEYRVEKERLLREDSNNNALVESVEKIFASTNNPADFSRFQSGIELNELFNLIENYGIREYVVFDMSIVRGLDYYTGVVWEVFDKAKTLRAIAGGGRYDNLIELFGGEKTPAAGFGMGDVVLYELLKEKGLMPPYRKSAQVYIVNFDRATLVPAVSFAAQLREKGVAAEFALKGQAVGKQLEAAKNARYAVFVGGTEWAEGKVKIKDMADGSEKVVPKDEAPGLLRK